jgi:hypothetical protein
VNAGLALRRAEAMERSQLAIALMAMGSDWLQAIDE